jgi:outer membrane receptor protein involved in Fe transport
MNKPTSCALVALLVGCMAAQTAHAQTTAGNPPPSDTVPALGGDLPNATGQTSKEGGDIVVTGSRIARRDYTSSSPISTVSSDFIAKSDSSTLETSLNQLPQIASSASSSTNTQARGGQASLDLRGLGQQRTLVLLDGRRVQPSAPDGSVDLNVIPANLIGNIEIITGGASAVYGSDAVTGVVNLKLRRDVSGIELSAKMGVSELGDAQTRDVNLIAGGKFADGKGSALVSIGYSDRKIAPFTSRDYLRGQTLVPALPNTLIAVSAANLPSQAAVNSIFAQYGAAPGTVSRSTQLSFNADGTLFSPTGVVNYRGSRDLPYIVYQGSLAYAPSETYTAQTPLTRYNIYARADYEVANDVKIFAEGFYTSYSVTTGGAYANAGSSSGKILSVPVINPFIPNDLKTYLASRPNPAAPFTITRFTQEVGTRGERNDYDVFQVTAGVEGKIRSANLDWSIVGSFGRTRDLTTETGYPSSSAIQTLLSAADGGRSICSGGYNVFGPQPVSEGCISYISRTARNLTILKQTNVEANLSGSLFRLPAGTLKFAVGADYRENTYSFSPDFLISSGDLANFLPVFGSSGITKATEGYGELLIPVIRNGPLVKEFNLDASYRYSHYNTVGGISTYKVDGDWTVITGLRIRGGYSRATRAPSAGELFAASNLGQAPVGSPGLVGSGDPCDSRGAYRKGPNATAVTNLCLAQGVPANLIVGFTNVNPRVPFQAGGNTALEPEKADTYSIGIVLAPKLGSPWLSHLTLSVDYYSIGIEQAIGQITNTVALSQCFDGTVNPGFSNSNYYCSLLARDHNNGQLTVIQNPLLNLASYKTTGIDTQLDWRVNFADIGVAQSGSFGISSVVSYLDTFKIKNLATAPTLDYAGTIGNQQIDLFADAHPRWKATSSATLALGGASLALRWRYIGKMANAANVGTGGTAHGVPGVSYFDLDLGFDVAKRFNLSIGAVNMFGKRPPILNDNVTGVLATDPYTYDLIGRRFYVGVKAKF